MEKHGALIAPDTLLFERFLPGPIDKVWAYLTESEKRGQWLAKGDMEPFEGGKVTLHFLHAELSPADDPAPEKYKDMDCGHIFTGKVLQYDPPHRLSFTWNDGSEVTFELQEQQAQVLLKLTHRKLSTHINTRVSVLSGWHTHLGILIARLEHSTPPGFWKVHKHMEEAYRSILES